MKTTLDIDETLYRRVKAKAAMEGRSVTELVEEGLRTVLGPGSFPGKAPKRVRLPLIRAKKGQTKMFEGMTNRDIHQRLTDLEAATDLEGHEASLRR